MFLIESFPYIFRSPFEFGLYYQRWVNVLPPIFLRDSSFYYSLLLLYIVAASKLLPIFFCNVTALDFVATSIFYPPLLLYVDIAG